MNNADGRPVADGRPAQDVFMLHHTYGPEEDQAENLKLIGVYSTRSNAEAALERVKDQPGFCTRQDGFEISSATLDQDG